MENLIDSIDLPNWVILVALIGGIIEIVKFIFSLFRTPVLEVKLTKEVFFRLSNWGESLFANVILLARNGIVEIKNVSFSLKRTTRSEKKYNLHVMNIGKKVKGDDVFAKHYFYTTSPIGFITEKRVARRLYNTVLKEYSTEISDKFAGFDKKIRDYVRDWTIDARKTKTEIEKNALFAKVTGKLGKEVDFFSQEIASLVQLESGSFKLVIDVNYKPVHWLFSSFPNKLARSTIAFEVESDFKKTYKSLLQEHLWQKANNISFPKSQQTLIFPEYHPRKISEQEKEDN